MKYEKLRQICKRRKRYEVIGWCCFVPAFILVVLCIASGVCSEQINDVFIGCILIAGFATIVASFVFSRFQAKWYGMATDYVELKIMEVISEFGIDSSKFELIQERPALYKVGFHNQMIDYEKLQSKIDDEVAVMNIITGDVTKVELI